MNNDFLLVINGITFLVYGYDKYLAKNNKWRISEHSLLLLAFLCGSIGAILAMLFFRHKTAKKSFYIPVILILFIQIGLVWYFGIKGLYHLM